MATENKNPNEIEISLLAVTPQKGGQFSAKAGKTYWFARAEIPAQPLTGNPFSTVRLTAVRNEPFPPHWIPGAKVRAIITNINGKDGEGSIDVPQV